MNDEQPPRRGQQVKVIDGRFARYTGRVDAIDVESRKICVLVSMLGCEIFVQLDLLRLTTEFSQGVESGRDRDGEHPRAGRFPRLRLHDPAGAVAVTSPSHRRDLQTQLAGLLVDCRGDHEGVAPLGASQPEVARPHVVSSSGVVVGP